MPVPVRPVRRFPTASTPSTPVPRPTWSAVSRLTAFLPARPLDYGAAVAGSAGATLVALALGLGSEPGVFAPFFVALVAVALSYGVGPALVTIATSALGAYIWLLSPMMALAFDPVALRHLAFYRLAVFAAAGVAIIGITEMQRRALQRLERSRRQLRAFVADDEVGLQVIDQSGRVSWTDPATPRLLGYEQTDYVGRVFADLHADRALGADVVARLKAGKPIENVRVGLVRKDGATQDVLLNSNTLLSDRATKDAGVLVAVLPLVPPVAAVDGKLAVSFLLERRRRAAADAQATRHRPSAEHAS